MEIKVNIRKFVQQFVSGKDFEDNTNIIENKLVNSLFAMQLVAFIEKEYDIILENSDIEIDNFKSVDAIAHLVESKICE